MVSSSTANNVLFAAFIEPCRALGGAGAAYLLLGSRRSLSLVDLLSLRTLWTATGQRYTAFAVAQSESETIDTVRTLGYCNMQQYTKHCLLLCIQGSGGEGWIYCGVAPANYPSSGGGPVPDDEEDASPEAAPAPAEGCAVLVYSLASPTPVLRVSAAAKVTCVLPALSQAFLCVLASGELYRYAPRGTRTSGLGAPAGKRSGVLVSVVPALEAALLDTRRTPGGTDPANIPLSSHALGGAGSTDAWLGRYLEADSSAMGSVDDIYSDLMASYLTRGPAATLPAAAEEVGVEGGGGPDAEGEGQ